MKAGNFKMYTEENSLDYLADAFEFAVKEDGVNLQRVAKKFRADREFVMAAVSQNALAFQYAADGFEADRVFVFVAMGADPSNIQFASAMLLSDREFILEVGEWFAVGPDHKVALRSLGGVAHLRT
nr:DUF4116 domain-containing protein [Gammaproteobacteria bacterium]